MSKIHLTLSMLRTLDMVAREGTFTRAADKLGMTQSGVSHAIKALEEALDAPLVVREGRQVSLSALGKQALQQSQIILSGVDDLLQLRSSGVVTGRVKLATVPSAAHRLVPSLFTRLRKEFPKLDLDYLEGTDNEIAHWTASGLVDLGISGVVGECQPELLAQDMWYAVMTPSHELADLSAVPLSEIEPRPFVMPGTGCQTAMLQLFNNFGIKIEPVLTVHDVGALIAMVRENVGVSILPAWVLHEDRLRGIVAKPLDPACYRSVYLLTRRDKRDDLTPAIDVVRDILKSLV